MKKASKVLKGKLFVIQSVDHFLPFTQTAISKQGSLMGTVFARFIQFWKIERARKHSICHQDTEDIADLEG
jgi:hypothetical protein